MTTTVNTETFDAARAKTFVKSALAVGFRNTEPTIYPKGGWSKDKGYDDNTTLDAATVAAIKQVLEDAGYNGCQILPGEHFSMCDGDGNVYGCEPGGFEQSEGQTPNPNQPLAYVPALSEASVEAALAGLSDANKLEDFQADLVRFVLSRISRKPATVEAYQVSEADGETTIETVHHGKVESTVVAQVGDWVVKQANGEVQRIEANEFAGKLRYLEVERSF